MKLIINIIRCAIFTIVMFYLIPYLYYGLGWLGTNAVIAINKLHNYFNPIVFWLILLVIVVGAFRFIWSLFKMIAIVIIWLANKICPYGEYAAWVTIIFTIVSFIAVEYGYWTTNGWPSFIDGIAGIIITIMGIGLLRAIFKGTLMAWNKSDKSLN